MIEAKRKKLARQIFIWALVIIIVYLAVQVVVGLTVGKTFDDVIKSDSINKSCVIDSLNVSMSDENVVEVSSIEYRDGNIYLELNPIEKGSTFIEITNSDGEVISSVPYKVSGTKIITNENTGNFTYCHLYFFIMIVFCVAITILLIVYFIKSYKELRYSYISIFSAGFALWSGIQGLAMIYSFIANWDMINVYHLIRFTAFSVILITSPLMIGFSILLVISNIKLIRREGFRFNNALGIILGFMILIGLVLSVILDNVYPSGSENMQKIFYAIVSVYWALFLVMECFLFGAILCAVFAGKHKHKKGLDYIIVLGCQIRKDGTLYPLIKSRVDVALDYYHKQNEAPIIICSGGKGEDEPISEGEAMKNYLLTQGVPEDKIIVEGKSKNTFENIKNSYEIINDEDANVAFATTNYHVFRAGILARKQEFNAVGLGAKTKWYFAPNAFVREVVGMLGYAYKDLIILFIPTILFLIAIQFYF